MVDWIREMIGRGYRENELSYDSGGFTSGSCFITSEGAQRKLRLRHYLDYLVIDSDPS